MLSYDPETGLFERNGKTISTINNKGYIVVRFEGKVHLGHRVAWFLMTGDWPKGEVDHKDRNRTNNRWENLRDVTHAQNNQNKLSKNRGIDCYRNHWRVRLSINGRRHIFLGSYDDRDIALATRIQAEWDLGAMSPEINE